MPAPVRGPTPGWFVARALDGWGPRLALIDAVVATVASIVFASTMRVVGGPRAAFEQAVPMLGTGLRWSVALPIAWGALGAIEADRRSGLLGLARRRGVSPRRWILGRSLGAATLVALTTGGPMMLLSLILSGFGGGTEGALARLSLVVPSMVMGVATGLVFGLGGVVLGMLLRSRMLAVATIVGGAGLGALLDFAVPGFIGIAAHQVVSPFLALEDMQAALFGISRRTVRGIAASGAIVALVLVGLRVAALAFARDEEELGGARS